MRVVYTSASYIWSVAKWIWFTVFVAIFVGVSINLLSGSKDNPSGSVSTAIKVWFNPPLHFAQILTITLFVLCIITTGASFFISKSKRLQKLYAPDPPV